MKHLSFGVPVENLEATCDFCFEENKSCFRSPKQRPSVWHSHTEIIHPEKYKMFGDNSPDHEFSIKHIEIEAFDICTDCITQLSSFKITKND